MINKAKKRFLFNIKSLTFFTVSTLALVAAFAGKKDMSADTAASSDRQEFGSYLAESIIMNASAQGDGDSGASCDSGPGACDSGPGGDGGILPPGDSGTGGGGSTGTSAPGTFIEIIYGSDSGASSGDSGDSSSGMVQ